jgi:plasmid stabilization system protein ParE
MAFRVEQTEQAERDILNILDWLIAEQAGKTGLRWFEGLAHAVASHSETPQRCPLAPENSSVSFEMRQLLYGRRPHLYRILFAIENDVVYVLRVRHGRRRRLDERGSS